MGHLILRRRLTRGAADEQARHAQSARAGEAAGAASLRARGPGHGGCAAQRARHGAGDRRRGGPTAGYEEADEEGRPQAGSPLLLLLRILFACAFDGREGKGSAQATEGKG